MDKMKILSLIMIMVLITSGTVVAKSLDDQMIAITEDENSKINIISDIGFEGKAPIDLYLESPVELILETEEFYYSGTTIDRIISIPDANLRQEIAWQLGKYENEQLYKSDLEQLEYLYAAYADITNLEGLQHAINLKYLTLSYNQIEDISLLEELKCLENLDISGNFISNLSLIANIESLTSLYLENMSIEDISFLNSLTKLRTVNLSRNNISESKLRNLHLPNLTDLNLSSNKIEHILMPSSLTSLSSLNLSGNNISDITALRQLDSLTDLNLSHNNIEDISVLSNLTSLSSLDLSSNNISNIIALKQLDSLTDLRLSDNSIEDISALSNLISLSSLDLSSNNISDLSVFSQKSLQYLYHLDLSYNNISDFTPLGQLAGTLTSLSLHSNEISDISFLLQLDLTQLSYIGLSGNKISDISILEQLSYNDYPMIHIYGQKFFIEDIEVEKGESVLINNPIKCPDWGNISYDLNNGEYHSDTNQFIWDKLNKNEILTAQFYLEEYNIPASIIYSGKIRQRVNVIGAEEEKTLPSIYVDDLQIKLGQKVDLLEGVTAFDEQDGNVTQSLQIVDSNVDFTKPGVYRVIYSANNLSGNQAQLERIITIIADDEDLNQDGIINESDLDLLSTYYNVTSQDSNWKENYDLNQDGIIDLYDTVLISSKIQPISITSFEANLSQVILDYIVKDEKVGDVTVDLLLDGVHVNEISGFISSTEETEVENEKRCIWNFNDILQSGFHNLKVIIKQNGEEIASHEINIIKSEISPITPLMFNITNELISVALQLDNFKDSIFDWQFYVNGIPEELGGFGGGDGHGYVEINGSLDYQLLKGKNIVGLKINYTVDGVTHIMSLSKYVNK